MASKKTKSAKDYTIIITEKPDATVRIAQALAEGRPVKKENRGAYWYEFERDKKKFLVLPAVGHIFALDTIKTRGGWDYPVFNVQWVPSYTKKGSEFSKKYFDNMEEMVKNGKNFIVATDYDTEGSVIGFNVLKFLCGVEDAKRMKFSTLTKDELIDSYKNVSEHLDFGQIESGLTRHYLDFYWGINLTRALTLAMKHSAERGFAILSTGRVQGPTLAMLLEKELEIRKFEPQPYWQLELIIKLDGQEYIANYEEARIWDKKIADDVVSGSKGKDAVVKDIKKKEYRQLPPVPFNTTDLQSDCYAHFKFSPTQTMGIAERLYQAGFISYPRSSSQKLPPSIGYKKILESLAKLKPYEKLAKQLLAKAQLLPNEGQRTDPAHPAVYPTAETADLNNLSPQQRKIYDLIIRRFLAVFADAAIRETMNVILDVGGNKFILVGKRTIESGWIDYYKPYATFEEQILPEIKIDQKIKVLKLDELAKETQPPGRFSQGSILKEMEKRELGTRATRAEILQTLYDRRYIIGKSIMVTKLGEVVTKVLKEFSPEVISEQLTRKFEEDMELVYEGKKKRETIVKEAEKFLVGVLKEFKKNENKIGKKLLEGLVDARKEERKLGSCPKCGNELRIIRSRRTGLFFVGCGGYPNCKNGYPLPHNARIDKTGRICEKCNTPIVRIIRAGKRPFNMCLDPKCETKKDWGKPKKTKDKNKVESKDKEVATEKKIEETKEIKKPSK